MVDFPTMHIIGDDDKVIPREMSDNLLSYFDQSKCVIARHDGGHILPAKGEVKSALSEFIAQRIEHRS